jgi:hypothetical protein
VHTGLGQQNRPTADELDDQLHRERIASDQSKPVFEASLKELPDGVFVQIPAWGEEAYVIFGRRLLKWSAGGYEKSRPFPLSKLVQVLTPKSTVATIRAGYAPEIHYSATSLPGEG